MPRAADEAASGLASERSAGTETTENFQFTAHVFHTH